MNIKIKLSKFDVARRQLETAIFLYFEDKDPISIHTLVCAAHEVIMTILKKKSIPMNINSTFIAEDKINEFNNRIKKARNFFKHADRDSNLTLLFNPEINVFLMLDACEKYIETTGEKPLYFISFRAWMSHIYPEIIKFHENGQQIKLFLNSFKNDKKTFFKTILSHFSL